MELTELKGHMRDALLPDVEKLLNDLSAKIMEPQVGKMEEARREVKALAGYMRDAYNRGSLNRPFKAISPEAEEVIEKVWKPLMVEGGKVDTREAMEYIQKTTTVSTEGTADQGGITVPEEFSNEVIRYAEENSVVWPRAKIEPMGTDAKTIIKLDQTATTTGKDDFAECEWYWTDEAGTKTQSKPKWKKIRLVAHKFAALWYSSEELVDDSAINIANFVVDLFRRAYVWKTDNEFINDTGNARPVGVLYDPGVIVRNRNTANQFYFQDALNMDSDLRPVFDAGAVWLMRKNCRNALRGQLDSNNSPVLKEYYVGPQSVEKTAINYLLGYPIMVTEKTSALGTAGDVILGNWAYYTIGLRQGFQSRMSYDFKFDEDLISWRFTGRLDGLPVIPEAFVILDGAGVSS